MRPEADTAAVVVTDVPAGTMSSAVAIDVLYDGHLHCRVTHGPSGQWFMTDAPKDHEGEGKAFSPTDLVASAVGACVATTMGILARRKQVDLTGVAVHVVKEMTQEPPRRIASLTTTVTMPARLSPEERTLLERAAATCPVHRSLHPDVHAPVTFTYL